MMRRRAVPLLAGAILALLVAGCTTATGGLAGAAGEGPSCPELQLPSLRDGAPPGEPTRARTEQGLLAITWGDPPHHVTEFVGEDADAVAGGPDAFATESWPRSRQHVIAPDGPRLVRPVGEPGVSQIQILLTRDGCRHVVLLPVGTSLDEAIRYARGL